MRQQFTPNTQCRHCGTEFYTKPSQLLRGRGRFCSTQCHDLYRAGDLADRFWSLVDKSGGPDACWPFQGCTIESGYGHIKFRGVTHKAHRLAYDFTHDVPLGDLFGCHTCDNPPCCNPKHIFPGTTQDNTLDMIAKGRHTVGARNGNAILNDDIVREIRSLHGTISVQQIAERFGTAVSTIEGIVSHRSWKHVA